MASSRGAASRLWRVLPSLQAHHPYPHSPNLASLQPLQTKPYHYLAGAMASSAQTTAHAQAPPFLSLPNSTSSNVFPDFSLRCLSRNMACLHMSASAPSSVSFSSVAPSSVSFSSVAGKEEINHEGSSGVGQAKEEVRESASWANNKMIRVQLLEQESLGLVTLSRPKALNALSSATMREVVGAFRDFDDHPKVAAIIITGEGKAFAAGADISEMKDFTFTSARSTNLLAGWDGIFGIRKPIIAAVNGYALGGGCELAMMCDIVLAGERALFGQPEVKLGVIPGMGGTQRLVRIVGKSRAMEMILTGGSFLDAREAVQRGLASRMVEGDNEALLEQAVEIGKQIAKLSKPAVMMAKEAVNSAYELGLREGIRTERNLFHATFGTEDQTDGMTAFMEKRAPTFHDK